MNVSIFIPCCIDQFTPQTGKNLISLLERLGHSVDYNPEQTCCGRLLYDNGNWTEAKEIGDKFINNFGIRNYIVGCSTSCIGYVKNNMGKLFFNTSNHNLYKKYSQGAKNRFEENFNREIMVESIYKLYSELLK